MKLPKVLAQPVGMILLAIALMMEKFLPATTLFDFIKGLFFGISIILNIYYIVIVFQKTKLEDACN